MKESISEDIRTMLRAIGPKGTKFTASDITKQFSADRRQGALTTLQRLVRQGEITVVASRTKKQRSRTYAVAAVGHKQVVKEPPKKKELPVPAWAEAWPHVYEGFKQRHATA